MGNDVVRIRRSLSTWSTCIRNPPTTYGYASGASRVGAFQTFHRVIAILATSVIRSSSLRDVYNVLSSLLLSRSEAYTVPTGHRCVDLDHAAVCSKHLDAISLLPPTSGALIATDAANVTCMAK